MELQGQPMHAATAAAAAPGQIQMDGLLVVVRCRLGGPILHASARCGANT